MSLVERVLILLYNWKGEDNATVIPPMKPIALNLITNINTALFSPGVTLKPTSLKKNFSSLKKNDFKTDSFAHYFKCSLKFR